MRGRPKAIPPAPLCHFSWSTATNCPLQARATARRGTQRIRMCTLHAWLDFESGTAADVTWDHSAKEPHLMEVYRKRCRQMGIGP